MISEYVTSKIDEALRSGWIKVYYQPVIRSLTGDLCGFESLARWEDPEHGRITPDNFISTLEDTNQIYKLDCYMVDRVCSDIHDRISWGEEMVPVSINFSRLDFLICDMLDVVEKAVEKYDIPRDYLHIEITESMVVSDGELMHKVLDSFRAKGYGIWMDDFGSGYSSLNLLKDFNFDVLKLDMKFLSSFTVKSKAVVKSVVTMAKDIGIFTLAEGVETAEEVEFLKEIGCGRLQGYYYGRPEPLEDVFRHMNEKGVKIEERRWHHFYDTAGFNVRATDTPLEIIEYDGKDFKTLFMNDAYKMQIFDDLPALADADRRIYHTETPLVRKYHEFAKAIIKSKRPETFYYTGNSNYLCFKGREIAHQDGRYLIKGSILNITIDQNKVKSEDLDVKLRELNHLFAVVLLFNPEEEIVFPLIGKFMLYKGPEKVDMNLSTKMLADNAIHPHDKERYIRFMNASTFAERIEQADNGMIEDSFRFKREDGSYWWALACVMMLSGSGGKEFLYCVKPIMRTSANTLFEHASNTSQLLNDEYSLLWNNFVWNSTVKFFWKDRDRRFKGVSKAFMDYFGLASEDEIIGKRGEEMKWHMNEPYYTDTEEDILRYGNPVTNLQCRCIINGVVHNTVSSKLPVYRDGEIVGLMGYIVDLEDELNRVAPANDLSRTDPVTGVMNAGAIFATFADYISKNYDSDNKFGMILIKNLKHSRIEDSYGREFANSVLNSMAEAILGITGSSCAVGRAKGSYFVILKYTDSREKLESLADQLKQEIMTINTVEGNSVTIKAAASVKFCTDYNGCEERMYEDALKELDKNDL